MVESETSLGETKAVLARISTTCDEAKAANAHEAPEMPPCKEQLTRLGIIVSRVEMRAAAAVFVDAGRCRV